MSELNDLQKKDMIRDVSEGGDLAFRFSDIPVQKFYEQAQYIESVLLPAIEKNRGKDSTDYIFFRSVFKSLLYAVMILDRDGKLMRERHRMNTFMKFYQTENENLQKELLKYTAIEDLYFSEGLDKVSAAVAARVENILNNKK